MIEFDVETTGLQWYWDEVFLVQFGREPDGSDAVVYEHPRDREEIQAWLRHDEPYRAWNTKFDLHFLEQAGYELPPPHLWHDGEVVAKLVDERFSAALKARADALDIRGGSDLQKEVKRTQATINRERKKASKETGEEFVPANYKDVWERDPKMFSEYALEDIHLTREVSNHYMPMLERDEKLVKLYELERGVTAALYDAERRGVGIDRSAVVGLESELLDDQERLNTRAIELAGIDTFNPRSTPQIVEALERRGVDITRLDKTKKGRSTDNDNLTGVDDELGNTILELRGVEKLLSTYVTPSLHSTVARGIPRRPFIGPDDRLHANFRQYGARHGRMSCAEPNLQNIPRDDLRIRYSWKAKPGHVLIACDLDQIEARLLAAFAGEGRLLDAFWEDKDIHTITATMVGLQDYVRAGGAVEPARQRGKKFLYSLMYGAGNRSVKKAFQTDDAGASEMIGRFHAAYPEVGNLQDNIAYQLSSRGFIRTKYGRRQRKDRVPYDVSYKFLNYLVSGTAADMLKRSAVELYDAGIPVIAYVHDEVIAESPVELANEHAEIIRNAMINHPEIAKFVPIDAEAKIVERWSDAKTKGENAHFIPDYMEA